MKSVAISVGDLNGIGIELALRSHSEIKKIVEPIYIIDSKMLEQAARLLGITIPSDFHTISPDAPDLKKFKIKPGKVSKKSGFYSFASFIKAVELAELKKVDAVCTLPIHKKAWEKAGLSYVGHTDFLRLYFKQEAIMMLGCPQMYVALYTEHIPLKDVAGKINKKDLTRFFVDFYNAVKPESTVAVLGLNPHAGDDGVLGDEEKIISKAIKKANLSLRQAQETAIESSQNTVAVSDQSTVAELAEVYSDPLVPDIAFTPNMCKKYTYYVAMYHDQGLAPLKALHFDEGINVSLNLPILRTSVDHGTAFDIAYKGVKLNNLSYINAIKYIAEN